jgi:membrane-associated protease RseP (regulator of RpoE activity)
MRQLFNRPTVVRWTIFAGGALIAAAEPASAQRDSVRVVIRGTSSGVEAEVAQVARELVEKKRMQVTLVRTLNELANQLQRVSGDADRVRMEQEVRAVRTRLTTTGSEGAELRRRLTSLCKVEHQPDGWLGVVLDGDVELQRDDDGEVSSRYLDHPTVVSVEPGSPAAKAGVEAGDRLLLLDGRDLRGTNLDIGALLRPGARLPMRVRRGMEGKSLQVLVERRPESFAPPCRWIDQSIAGALREVPNEMAFIVAAPEMLPAIEGAGRGGPRPAIVPTRPASPMPSRVPAPPEGWGPLVYSFSSNGMGTIAGAQVTTMNQDLGDTFGVDRGLLVLKVLPGTPAEQSGLRGGDVVLSANGTAIGEPLTLQRAINNARTRELQLSIVRRKKPLTILLHW